MSAGESASLDSKEAVTLDDTRGGMPGHEKLTLPHKETSDTGEQPPRAGKTTKEIMPDNQQNHTAATTGMPSTSGRLSALPAVARDSSRGEEPPDFNNWHETECIMKQRNTKNGTQEFLVRWADRDATDTWINGKSLSDDLLLHWRNTHTRKGAVRKELNISHIGTLSLWAHRRGWSSDSTERNEEVDQYGNEI